MHTSGIGRHVMSIEFNGSWSGQGVVVPDQIVLTAAHCLPAPQETCFLADQLMARVRRPDGKIGIMQAAFIDAVSDIAALVCLDEAPFFLDGIDPIAISLDWSRSLFFVDRQFKPGRFFSHDVGEVEMQWKEIANGSAVMNPSRRIFGGTSGGPIVDEEGQLIGLVCNSHTSARGCEENVDAHDVGDEISSFRLLGSALPPWLSARLVEGSSTI